MARETSVCSPARSRMHSLCVSDVSHTSSVTASPADSGPPAPSPVLPQSQLGRSGESQAVQTALRRTLPTTLGGGIRCLGQELTCAICLGILEAPTVAPCQHSFCAGCLERMLRVAGRTDGACPICKMPVSRRALRPQPRLRDAVAAFLNLASAYEAETGCRWEDACDGQAGQSPAASAPAGALPRVSLAGLLSSDDEGAGQGVDTVQTGSSQASVENCPPSWPCDQANRSPRTSPRRGRTSSGAAAKSPAAVQPPSGPVVICASRCRLDVPGALRRLRRSGAVATAGALAYTADFCPRRTTHLVVGTLPPPSLDASGGGAHRGGSLVAAGRTVKYLQAVLCGCWVVAEAWLADSERAGRLLDPAPYELCGDELCPDEATPRRARLALRGGGRAGPRARLLGGLAFRLVGEFGAPDRTIVAALIRLGGGAVLESSGSVGSTGGSPGVISLHDPDVGSAKGVVTKTGARRRRHSVGGVPLTPVAWLLASISAYQLLPPDAAY